MMKEISAAILLILLGSVSSTAQEPSADRADLKSNARLAELFEADQSDRQEGVPAGTELTERDEKRREEVSRLLREDRLRTAKDFFRAAMIFQHGSDSTHFKRAHRLAARAEALDSTLSTARWLTAATWDRYLLTTGRPQIYGTQFVTYNGKWYLRRMDTTQVSDAEREKLGVRTLDQIRVYLKERNDTTAASLAPPPVSIEIQ